MEKKLDGNYTRMLRTILNGSWKQQPTIQQVYGHLPPITKTIKSRRTRHAGYCYRSRDELVSDVLLWTPNAARPVRTYIQQLYVNTECSPEDLPKAKDDREVWRERVRNIHAGSARWWWWWWWWFQTIQLNISYSLVLFDPLIGPNQLLPLRDRVYLGAMAMKGYSTFPKAPTLLEPHDQIFYCHISGYSWGVGSSYPSAEKQLVYSTAQADWSISEFNSGIKRFLKHGLLLTGYRLYDNQSYDKIKREFFCVVAVSVIRNQLISIRN